MQIHAGLLLNLKRAALFLIIATAIYFTGTALRNGGEQQSATEEISTSTDQTGLLIIEQLVELVGPIALYPDELLAIVIPASAYPLEIVQAMVDDYNPDSSWEEVKAQVGKQIFMDKNILCADCSLFYFVAPCTHNKQFFSKEKWGLILLSQ